jgi:predicted membrane protein
MKLFILISLSMILTILIVGRAAGWDSLLANIIPFVSSWLFGTTLAFMVFNAIHRQ